jgi:hypothetical protein
MEMTEIAVVVMIEMAAAVMANTAETVKMAVADSNDGDGGSRW